MAVIEKRLEELGITLPAPLGPTPLAEYVMVRHAGEFMFLSGMGPMKNGMPVVTGRLVRDMKHEDGYAAARIAALNLISLMKAELGDLDRVDKIIKLTGWVACDSDFYDQHMILNGASHVLNDIFGERGHHVCTALSAHVLPFNMPVVIELVIKVKP